MAWLGPNLDVSKVEVGCVEEHGPAVISGAGLGNLAGGG